VVKFSEFLEMVTWGLFSKSSHLAWNDPADVDMSRTLVKEQCFGDIIDKLSLEFEERFSECRSHKSLFRFIIDPFSFSPDDMTLFIPLEHLPAAQMALLELQCDVYLNSTFSGCRDYHQMWKSIFNFPSYSVLCTVAKRVLCMFGSTYRCESSFSAMKSIKSKERNRMTDLHLVHCIRAVVAKYVPSFTDLVNNMQCQPSH